MPMYLPNQNDREKEEFSKQLERLHEMYSNEADFLSPVSIESIVPPEADAILFPQLIGSAFSAKNAIAKLAIPAIVLTSEFGTVEMWDWEIVSFLRDETDITVFSPYQVELARVIIRAIAAKRHMQKGMKFLMFQDSPGEGMQANIFKRFYWWEDECTKRMEKAFGIEIIYKSYKELNLQAESITDAIAEETCANWNIPMKNVPRTHYLKAVKLYLATKKTIADIGEIHGIGANCLNESFNSQTTPCLAWNMLYELDGILWACEGDTVTMVSKFIIYSALKRPIMMTNIYNFLVGMAALKHEKIDNFPDVPNPDNHALGVHCGYFGLAPQSFCSKWELCPKVLEIVSDDALMVDCEMAPGPITIAKVSANLKKMIIIQAQIKSYEKYPGSDCRNGALIHFTNNNGHEIMETLSSHHALIIQGECTHELVQLASVYGFDTVIM